MFKQGDWVKYKDEADPFIVDRVVGYNVYIYPYSESYQFGWHDPRAIFGGHKVETHRLTTKVLDRDCTLIPKEVVDIMRGV
jgi:hypothetical protein